MPEKSSLQMSCASSSSPASTLLLAGAAIAAATAAGGGEAARAAASAGVCSAPARMEVRLSQAALPWMAEALRREWPIRMLVRSSPARRTLSASVLSCSRGHPKRLTQQEPLLAIGQRFRGLLALARRHHIEPRWHVQSPMWPYIEQLQSCHCV